MKKNEINWFYIELKNKWNQRNVNAKKNIIFLILLWIIKKWHENIENLIKYLVLHINFFEKKLIYSFV